MASLPLPPQPLSSDTRTLTLAPNLTVTALKPGPRTITVAQSTASIANALASFVKAYNAAVTALDGAARDGRRSAGRTEHRQHPLPVAARHDELYRTAARSRLADLGIDVR